MQYSRLSGIPVISNKTLSHLLRIISHRSIGALVTFEPGTLLGGGCLKSGHPFEGIRFLMVENAGLEPVTSCV